MNFLKDKKIYLSGPIEHDNSGHNWRHDVIYILTNQFGLSVFDPFSDPKQQKINELKAAKQKKDFYAIREIAKSFVRKDLSLVDRADILIAYLPSKIRTCGTYHEIINSNNAKKPTLLVCPEGRENIPVWLYGFIPLEFMFDSWNHLFNYLNNIHTGYYTAVNDRWNYTYGKI